MKSVMVDVLYVTHMLGLVHLCVSVTNAIMALILVGVSYVEVKV